MTLTLTRPGRTMQYEDAIALRQRTDPPEFAPTNGASFDAFAPQGHHPEGLQTGAPATVGESLKEAYDRYFRVIPAGDDNLREQSFRMRYQVYCVENTFEPAEENPGGIETDEYDAQSLHSLLVHGEDELVVGTVRLILPRMNGHDIPLPIRRVCSPETLTAYANHVPAGRAAEISRFAITRQFRRRAGEVTTVSGETARLGPGNPARLIPHISLGLMQAVLAMAIESEVSHLYAAMEPTLLRMLQRLGIYFENLGPVVDYHGRRQPCFCDIDDMRETILVERPDVWSVVTDDGRLSTEAFPAVRSGVQSRTAGRSRSRG